MWIKIDEEELNEILEDYKKQEVELLMKQNKAKTEKKKLELEA